MGCNMVGKVFGVGANDVTPISEGGVHIQSYQAWKNMLKRCYDQEWQSKNLGYIGCCVDDCWLTFSNFKSWFDVNHKPGYELDKDLLIPGNRRYAPETCVFIPKSLNTFTTSRAAERGAYPIGVHFHAAKNRFIAQISVNAVREQIGAFTTAGEAHLAWHRRKIELAYEYKALCYTIFERLFEGVLSKINSMKEL